MNRWRNSGEVSGLDWAMISNLKKSPQQFTTGGIVGFHAYIDVVRYYLRLSIVGSDGGE